MFYEQVAGILVQCEGCGWRTRYDGGPCVVCRGEQWKALEPPRPPSLATQVAIAMVDAEQLLD